MGWLEKLMFWRDGTADVDDRSVADHAIEQVEGYTVDGCFTGPSGEALLPEHQASTPTEDPSNAPLPDGAPPASS